jgi:hypothetical protein
MSNELGWENEDNKNEAIQGEVLPLSGRSEITALNRAATEVVTPGPLQKAIESTNITVTSLKSQNVIFCNFS